MPKEWEIDYKKSNVIPPLEEATRRVVRRYGMIFRTDADELCDLCVAYVEEKGGTDV